MQIAVAARLLPRRAPGRLGALAGRRSCSHEPRADPLDLATVLMAVSGSCSWASALRRRRTVRASYDSVKYEQLFTVNQFADLGPTEDAPAAARQFARSVL